MQYTDYSPNQGGSSQVTMLLEENRKQKI